MSIFDSERSLPNRPVRLRLEGTTAREDGGLLDGGAPVDAFGVGTQLGPARCGQARR
jgi:hypothetical protein